MRRGRSISQLCAAIAESPAFLWSIFAVIVINAAALGAETYRGFAERHSETLDLVNDTCLGIFVVELTIRIAAHGRRPHQFFRSGWNVFDFVVVAAGFTPGLGKDTTVLRLVRLARVLRVVSILPHLRIVTVAIGRSIPGVAALAVMALLLVYVYAIVGWLLFGDQLPQRWGDVGTAMLNLFVMLSLENLPDNLREGMEVHPWSWIFFVSYALTASFLLLNILIGVVINSLEEARALEHRRERQTRIAAREAGEEGAEAALALLDAEDQAALIAQRVSALRDALDDLEDELRSADGRRGGVGGRTLPRR